MYLLSKEQSVLSKETIQNAFFSELCPFYDLDFLSSINHPTALVIVVSIIIIIVII